MGVWFSGPCKRESSMAAGLPAGTGFATVRSLLREWGLEVPLYSRSETDPRQRPPLAAQAPKGVLARLPGLLLVRMPGQVWRGLFLAAPAARRTPWIVW